MHFWDAVVLIFLIAAVVWLRSNRYRTGALPDRLRGRRDRQALIDTRSDSRESELEAEIAELHQRIAVLERIATDERKSRDIAAEIEALRDAPPAPSRQSTNG